LGASRLLIELNNKVHPTNGSNHPSRNVSFAQNASGNKANVSSSSNSGSDDKEKAEDGPAK